MRVGRLEVVRYVEAAAASGHSESELRQLAGYVRALSDQDMADGLRSAASGRATAGASDGAVRVARARVEVVWRGVELCEPCCDLSKQLQFTPRKHGSNASPLELRSLFISDFAPETAARRVCN